MNRPKEVRSQAVNSHSCSHLEQANIRDTGRRQPSRSAAELDEAFHLPALPLEWADPFADAAAVASHQHVLDVACGTVAAVDIARPWESRAYLLDRPAPPINNKGTRQTMSARSPPLF